MKIEEKVQSLIAEPLDKKGFKLIKVEYVKEEGHKFLRIIIDREEPVDIDKCVIATRIINKILDKGNIIDEEYILDVCSHQRGGE